MADIEITQVSLMDVESTGFGSEWSEETSSPESSVMPPHVNCDNDGANLRFDHATGYLLFAPHIYFSHCTGFCYCPPDWPHPALVSTLGTDTGVWHVDGPRPFPSPRPRASSGRQQVDGGGLGLRSLTCTQGIHPMGTHLQRPMAGCTGHAAINRSDC